MKPATNVVDNGAFVLQHNKDFIQHNINLASDRSQGLLPPISSHSPTHSLSRKASVQPVDVAFNALKKDASQERYETKEEQNIRLVKQNVKRMQNFLGYNPYDLKNYRADNPKLPFSLPGEKF